MVAALGIAGITPVPGLVRAAVPPAEPGFAIVNVRVAGDRDTISTIFGLPGARFGLFAARPTAYNSAGFTTETPRYECTSDPDGDCSFRVPIGPAPATPSGTRLWVAPTAPPTNEWFASQSWQTAPLLGSPTNQTQRVFQTPQLASGGVYTSGSATFMGDPGNTTAPSPAPSEFTRRIASGGEWPLSRANPPLVQQCGLNVAMVVDLSSSMATTQSVPDLIRALNAFVDALRGTPSQAALFTFSTDTPAVRVAENHDLMSVAHTTDADRFKALYSGWTNDTANGYTNWDSALHAVAEVNANESPTDHFDVVIFLTDGNPTAFHSPPLGLPIQPNPGQSGFTRFREMETAVASANRVKSSGGRIVGTRLEDGTRVLAVGVGAGLNVGADANLRAISGPLEYSPEHPDITEADFYRTTDFETVGETLRPLFLAHCAPTVTVIKRIVPHGGTIDDSESPGLPWHFSATPTNPDVGVTPDAGDTSVHTGAINFDLEFTSAESPAGLELQETPQTGFTRYPVNDTGTGAGTNNAHCINKSEDDKTVPVTNLGTTGFRVDVDLEAAVTCTVYNEAPPEINASVVASKRWRVTTASGTTTYENGAQPEDLQARLDLTGPGSQGAIEQPWDEERHGYAGGVDHVTVSEHLHIGLPGCTFTGGTISDSSTTHPITPGSPSASFGPVAVGVNRYTVTNDVVCHSHLTLLKEVRGGHADPASWTLSATAPAGALPGPSGTTGVSAEVTPEVRYQLAEQLNSSDPGLLNYVPASFDCDSSGQDGGVVVPLGQDVTCVAVNQTAPFTLTKHVDGGAAAPSAFTYTLVPVNPVVPGIPTQTVTSGHTIFLRPGQEYRISESGLPGYTLAELRCAYGGRSHSGDTLTIPIGSDAVCDATNTFEALEPGVSPTPTPEPPPSTHAGIELFKQATLRSAGAGQRIVYRIIAHSTGPAAVHDLRICDRMPDELKLVRAAGATTRGAEVCWTRASLAAGQRASFDVEVRVRALRRARDVRNVVRATAANADPATATVVHRLRAARRARPHVTG